MQKDKKYYDDFFNNYPVNVHDNPDRFRAVAKLLSGKVLDVACGTGTLSDYYTGDYVGVDISDVAIAKAREIRRKNANFHAYNFIDSDLDICGQFDCAYLGEFLEHIENDDIVFEKLKRFVKPDGKIVVSVPNGSRIPDESHCRIFTVASIRRDYSKYGKVRFHNWIGFEKRILFSIELGAPDPNEMSLVMIVKDEAKGIEKAIISALPLVDRVVVSVDDKTIDKTEEIAKMYADELLSHTWQDNFSKARNDAAKNVKSRWILFLDGHEYIESFGKIREKMKSFVDGIFVTVRMENGMTFLYPRIYRTGLQFKNAVHNLVECKTKSAEPAFVIVHDRDNLQEAGASERRNRQRVEMLPKHLKNQIKENPKSSRAHFHLANYYMSLGDFKLAKKHYKKVIKYSFMPDEVYYAYMTIGRIQMQLGHKIFALFNFIRADELLPGRWESARVLGGYYFLDKRWEKAAEFLSKALDQNRRHYTFEPMKQNKSEIWDMIGHCFEKMDQPAKAVIAWKEAAELAEDDKHKRFFLEKVRLAELLLK